MRCPVRQTRCLLFLAPNIVPCGVEGPIQDGTSNQWGTIEPWADETLGLGLGAWQWNFRVRMAKAYRARSRARTRRFNDPMCLDLHLLPTIGKQIKVE